MLRRVRAVAVAFVVAAVALTSGGCGTVQLAGRGPVGGHRPTHEPSGSASHHAAHRSVERHRRSAGAGEPVALTIPALHVHADVLSRGTDTDGFNLAADIHDVAWYTGSAVPGAPGTAYLAGHRDDDQGDHGALYKLGDLHPGAVIVISTTAGPLRYRVTAVTTVEKTALAGRPLPTRGRSRLLLATCGGPLVRHTPGVAHDIPADGLLHYADNVLVTAVETGLAGRP